MCDMFVMREDEDDDVTAADAGNAVCVDSVITCCLVLSLWVFRLWPTDWAHCNLLWSFLHHLGLLWSVYYSYSLSSSSLLERCRFHDFTAHATVHGHYALCLADHSLRFCCLRSFSIVRSHVCRGRPRGRLHSFGGSSMPALRARVWSPSESERTMWPKNLRRMVWVTGWERMRTSWLVTCAVKGTCRMCRMHHWSLAGLHRHIPQFWGSEPYSSSRTGRT